MPVLRRNRFGVAAVFVDVVIVDGISDLAAASENSSKVLENLKCKLKIEFRRCWRIWQRRENNNLATLQKQESDF